jgi:hypothetical protein
MHHRLPPDICGPTTTAGRPEYFTQENVDRYLARPRSTESTSSASPSTSTASPGARVWRTRYWGPGDGRPRRLLRVRRTTPLRLGIECDFVPAARTGSQLLGARLRLRRRLRPFLGDGRRRRRRYDVWEPIGTPDALGSLSSTGRPSSPARACSTSSPIRTWSRSGAPTGPRPSAIRASTTSRSSRRSPSRDRRRGLDRGLRKPVGEIYRRAPCRDVRRGGRRVRPVLRRHAPTRWATLRPARSRCFGSSVWSGSASSEGRASPGAAPRAGEREASS